MSELRRYHDLILDMLSRNYTYSRMSVLIQQNYGTMRGLSARSIRRYGNENNLINRYINIYA